MRQLVTRIDDSLHRRLKVRARLTGRSVNAWVVAALERALADEPTAEEAFDEQLRQRGLWWQAADPEQLRYRRDHDEAARRAAAQRRLQVSDLLDALRDDR